MKEEEIGDNLNQKDLVNFLLDRINGKEGMSQHGAQLSLVFIEKRGLKAKDFSLTEEKFQALRKALEKMYKARNQIPSCKLDIERLKQELKETEEKLVRLLADADATEKEAQAEVKSLLKKGRKNKDRKNQKKLK